MKYAVLILALVALAQSASLKVGTFSWDNCNADDPIHLTALSILPDPIVIPGTVDFSITIDGNVLINSPTAIAITLEEKAADGTWANIPCHNGFGSCSLPDACALLELIFPPGKPCPDAFVAANAPCNCPIPAGSYDIEHAQIVFAEPLEDLTAGDYHAKLVLTQTAEVACYEFYFTLVGPDQQ